MTPIKWAYFLDLGMPNLDEQHKHLVSVINEFLEAAYGGAGEEALRPTLQELFDYTCYHFEAEEKFMAHIDYPELDAHRREHVQLRHQVEERLELLLKRQASVQEMQAFLTSWIVGHLMGWDGMLASFVKNNWKKPAKHIHCC